MWAQSTGALEMLGFCPQLQLPGLHPAPRLFLQGEPPDQALCALAHHCQSPHAEVLAPATPSHSSFNLPPTPATASSCADPPGRPHCSGAHRGEAGRSRFRAERAGPDSPKLLP